MSFSVRRATLVYAAGGRAGTGAAVGVQGNLSAWTGHLLFIID